MAGRLIPPEDKERSRKGRNRSLLFAALAVSGVGVLVGAAPPATIGFTGMVAADHFLASRAGADVLELGGNAVDAAVATALAAGVVQPAGSGLGGGGFALVVSPEEGDGQPRATVLDFREVAPASSRQQMFVLDPDGQPVAAKASRKGGLAVAVPGEGPGLALLHAQHGELSWRSVVKPALKLARGGFPVGWHLGEALHKSVEHSPNIAVGLFGSLYVNRVPTQGEWVRRAGLAKTLQAFARHGEHVFRKGPIADAIVETVRSEGGILTSEDLEDYAPKERVPIAGEYRGWKVITMPPPSSGGVVLLQVLGVLEGFPISEMEMGSADLIHLMAEACKHAFADRAQYMGDPDRVDVPVEDLISSERIHEVQNRISMDQTLPRDAYGMGSDVGEDAGTQHISVVDRDGMSVALTTTINTSFGSGVAVPEWGLVLNNEMDDFVARPGEPNAYGLVGSEANAVAPGARPLSSMSPTVLIGPDGTRIAVGASGGPFIITSVLQAIVAVVDFGANPSEAVTIPRVHHQWVPEKLFVDDGIGLDTRNVLAEKGHEVQQMPFFSSVQMVVRDGDGAMYQGASDPRKGGLPAGAGIRTE